MHLWSVTYNYSNYAYVTYKLSFLPLKYIFFAFSFKNEKLICILYFLMYLKYNENYIMQIVDF